ncbi:MAG: peptidylprolyl isomerase [Verrucomicrobia bacterium]|nr:peptidylprolyl isomerase [Verrucomicrobiota bacterium]
MWTYLNSEISETQMLRRPAGGGRMPFRLIPLLLVLALPNAGAAETAVLLDGVAAHVNKHVITVGDVLILMEPTRRQLSGRLTGLELQKRLAEEYQLTLDGLIDRFVVLDAYEKGEGRIPDWAVDKRADEVIRESFSGDRQSLLDALAVEGMTYKDWRKKINEQMIVASMRSTTVEQNVSIAPDELQRHYDAHQAKFATPAKTHLRLIVIKRTGTNVAARATAESALARVRGGEDFGEVAKDVSQGMKAGEGGDWGWVEAGTLRPELTAAVADMAPGTVSDIIETDADLYLIEVLEQQPAATPSLADARVDIENVLRMERAEAIYKDWMARLRQDSYVRVFDLNMF